MGTAGKRFGDVRENIGHRVEDIRSRVGDKLESIQQRSGQEGELTRKIESVTSAMPSSTWLLFAGASMLGSLGLKAMRRDQAANFVGQWVPTFLLLGIYNKLVKIAGSERQA